MPASSRFARAFGADAGIARLMDDLGEALAIDGEVIMLGGGNPGQIPDVNALFRERMQAILDDGDAFERLVGNYDPPRGDPRFIEALAALLREHCHWDVGPENIAVTNGSQSASFMLFNILAGEREAGTPTRVMLPIVPEYIGYADQGIGPDFFVAARPGIEELDARLFKYHVDFSRLAIDEQVAAICISRPTNPTGNVLTDEEVAELSARARARGIPLIVDSAYGTPFPGIVFTPATPVWEEHLVVCMSLSKLGLPGVRTGIVVARPELVDAISTANAILNLTTGGFGPALALEMVRSADVLRVSRETIRPFYEEKARAAVAHLRRALAGTDFWIHKPEGAIFLWLWFRELPISSEDLYQRLKRRGVLVISGHHFFPGFAEDWRHRHECIRVTYAQSAETVGRGIEIIADEVKKAYAEA